MEWLQACMIAGSTIGACWMMHKENKELSKKFNDESKDFHARLCVLEERYLQMMHRIIEKKE
jgi:hypothetical protein